MRESFHNELSFFTPSFGFAARGNRHVPRPPATLWRFRLWLKKSMITALESLKSKWMRWLAHFYPQCKYFLRARKEKESSRNGKLQKKQKRQANEKAARL